MMKVRVRVLRLGDLGGVLLAQLLDEPVADAGLAPPGGRREVAVEVEVGALRAGKCAVALHLPDAAAIASFVDSVVHRWTDGVGRRPRPELSGSLQASINKYSWADHVRVRRE